MKPLYYLTLIITLYSCNFNEKEKLSIKVLNASLEYKIESKLGEGAFWNHKTHELYWIDILDNSLHIYSPKNKTNRTLQTPSSIGTVVPSNIDNESIIALQDGIYIIDTNNGYTELLSDVERDIPSNRFNDGKCDPSGRLWVGSMAFSQERYKANLYMINAKGDAQLKKDSVTISNGIVWSKDRTKMYYIDTPTAEIKAYDYDNGLGNISNERIVTKIHDSLGFPDGMTIDENDNLWVGMWNGNAVLQFDSETGKLISKVNVPAHNVTACAFGGEGLDTLYITTASVDMNAQENEQFPLAGSIFKIKTEVKGVKSSFFKTN
ncbi:SMP-30/gluconolactonase/LRE family protein [uncultured Psychroserpens sp.]|uniref:SMP-30/gluconolactonase/LRE family protein n=1 Tax=uncultured Psychroserpens sp. TaxID=255436 RepID=UPI0026102145|nr:SMP-30/gluconolactonase/LRE family protein [uncultured Psychroserpens sp.]